MSMDRFAQELVSRLARLEEASARHQSMEVPRARMPLAIIYHSATQSIANNTSTALVFNSEAPDDNDWHSVVTNPSRITVTLAGQYLAVGQVEWASNATGYRQAALTKNGGAFAGVTTPATTGAQTTLLVVMPTVLTAGDYVELFVAQGSGGALNVNGGAAAVGPYLAVVRLSG